MINSLFLIVNIKPIDINTMIIIIIQLILFIIIISNIGNLIVNALINNNEDKY